MGGDGGRGAQNGMSADHRAQIDDLQAQVGTCLSLFFHTDSYIYIFQ
jgi:hypothetical protein